MPALTAAEARERAALLTVDSYDVRLDLTVSPVRSRAVVRFRCATPGAASFAELAATPGPDGATLNGVPLGPAADGRLALPGLAAGNVLTTDCVVPERALTRFTDPAGGEYLLCFCYPTLAPSLLACFDQLDQPAPLSLTLVAPAGWNCVANGPLASRPAPGEAGPWRFAPARLKPLELTWCAGPLRAAAVPPAGLPVTLTSYARSALASLTATYLNQYSQLTAAALAHHAGTLAVPRPGAKCDIVALPDVPFRAACVPGLMLVGEDELARLADPGDDFTAMIAAHESAHLWFGGLVGMRWWDDLWLEEALATYLTYWSDGSWAAFGWTEKPRALLADELPTRQPVTSPVASMAQALDRPAAITYVTGAALIRQLAALIGPGAVQRGLTDYLTRFGPAGSAGSADLVGCWSRAAGTDLAGWAAAWLRTAGLPRLSAAVTAEPGGAIVVTQDPPRPQKVQVALYDAGPPAGPGQAAGPSGALRLRRTITAELTGARTTLAAPAGEPPPAAVFANAGDWALAHVTIDAASLAVLAGAAFDVGDPLTEGALWNAAWHMVRAGELAPADYALLAARRVAAASAAGADGAAGRGPGASGAADRPVPATPLTPAAAEALLSRALTCADRYVPDAGRVVIRTALADVALGAALTPGVPAGLYRALLAGFAASAQTEAHLAAARARLDQAGPDAAGLALRGALVRALAVAGQARPADLDGLTAADPVAGEPLRVACAAARPDPSAKEAAWSAALDPRTSQRLARAAAAAFWVPGQDALLAGYRERYFTEALPGLCAWDADGERRAPRLARLLFPGTLADPVTLAAARAALDGGGLTARVHAVLLEEEAELRRAATLRAAAAPT